MSDLHKELKNYKNERFIQAEYDYIWDYCKKTGFDKYVTPNYVDYFKKLILKYGFCDVQQVIRYIHKWDFKTRSPFVILERELFKKNVDKEELMKIPAYIDATTQKYNDKINRELGEHQERLLAGNLNKYNSFNNFDPRDRSENNSSGYWSWEEIESALLDRSEIDEDKKSEDIETI